MNANANYMENCSVEISRAAKIHASAIRQLFGFLLQISSGGKSISELPDAILQASDSYIELNTLIKEAAADNSTEWRYNLENALGRAVESEIQLPDNEYYQQFPDSFAAHKNSIISDSMKCASRILRDLPGGDSRPSQSLRTTIAILCAARKGF